jgi:polygalacturonase
MQDNPPNYSWWPQAFCGDWWPFGKRVGERGGRPRMILLLGCEQVRLRDVTRRNAASWTVHLVRLRRSGR